MRTSVLLVEAVINHRVMLFSRKFKKNERRERGRQRELCKASGVLKDLLIYGGDASAKRRGAILEEWMLAGG